MASSASHSRDSHDLSLNPRDVTRDSLVTNMLMSLDQFSLGQSNTHYADDANYDDAPQIYDSNSRRLNSLAGGGRSMQTHHQYSCSSDFEAGDDHSRMSSQTSRGRRSNSSSNTPAPFSRFSSQAQRGQPSPRGLHSRGGRGSKSSSSASIDTGYMNSPRHQRGTLPRPASFDQTNTQHSNSVTRHHPAASASAFQVEFPRPLHDDDGFEAAPTPTIPPGPRRIPSSPSVPRAPPEPTHSPKLDRKRSTSRSLRSSAGRKPAAAKPPPTPVLDLGSAPAPHVGYEKAKEPMASEQLNPAVPTPVKEKTGFFRRVFGGGSKSQQSNNVNAESPRAVSHHTANDSSEPTMSNRSNNQQPPQSSYGPGPPSRDTASSHSHRPIQKKSSSFFRRLKKSAADEPPMPNSSDVPPVPSITPIAYHASIEKPEASPVSSLRLALNPYLHTSQPGTSHGVSPLNDVTNRQSEKSDARAEYKREFSPDYEPSPKARIRAVRSNSDRDLSHVTDSPSRKAPSPPTKPVERDGSFLDLDLGSDNEDLPIQANNSPEARAKHRPNAPTSPLSPADTIRPSNPPLYESSPEPSDSPNPSNLALPIEGARTINPPSPGAPKKPSPHATPKLRVEISADAGPKPVEKKTRSKGKGLDEPDFVVGEPTEDDRQKAQRIFDGNEDFIQKEKAASWMGEEGPIRQRTLQAYMDLYSFENQSIVESLRTVCGRLVFRAETQQVDRILVAFANRWCKCNPNHGFKSIDVIHTICYSIMLLNTDLHLADIEQKMTRSQFIKNTLETIIQTVEETAPDAFKRSSDKNNMLGIEQGRNTPEHDKRSFRHSFKPPPRGDGLSNPASPAVDACGPLVKTPFNGTPKAWEDQVEVVLRSIYSSIRDGKLPLFGAEPERNLSAAPSQSNLSVIGMLKRSPSVLSKSPSESFASTRGRISDSTRMTASRWSSKSRSRPGIGRTGMSSSRTSFDDDNSLWSPAMSSATWSRYSLGRTQTSFSQDSLGSAMRRGEYQQSIGFANALSQAIIRDEDMNGNEVAPSIMSMDMQNAQLLEDESLELSGPPWVKEGMVIHKHHLDGVDKKAKERNWSEVFAVIQKGQMNLFSFSASKSLRHKNRSRGATKTNAPVGGGNWQDNATSMGSFSLRQTLASALPPPGYSRTRPHVWALSLPNGAVHLFQVGTPEIIKEFVNTVNYWSARLSTHPLVGGISNIEYGWSENIVNNSLVTAINNDTASTRTSRPGSAAAGRRSSVQSGSFRSVSLDQTSGGFTHRGSKLPGDRIHIAGWTPPTQSLRPSTASESEQLHVLQSYVKNIEEDLQAHNQLRSPMLLAFTPRAHNAGKAMANWERKSSYLLREIVKYRTYVDTLVQAEARKREIYNERDLARRAARGELSDRDMEVSGSSGDEDEEDVTLRP